MRLGFGLAFGLPLKILHCAEKMCALSLRFAPYVVEFCAMLSRELLELLVCPACKQALEYRENPESLKCKQCRRVYAVKDNIPIMLIDEATVEP